jgi:hypothetical protein
VYNQVHLMEITSDNEAGEVGVIPLPPGWLRGDPRSIRAQALPDESMSWINPYAPTHSTR